MIIARTFPAVIVTITATVAAASLVLAVSFADTPPIRDESGDPVPGSIASLERVELLGIEQWILVRGWDADAPVLLWLSGGPGGSEIGWTRKYLEDLERHFVFVNWEQPGAGKSYRSIRNGEITPDGYADHVIALSEMLRSRFGGRKIVLAGHSWGSIIGLMAADRRPDLYLAYIGISQQVNIDENDAIGYSLVLEGARERGERAVVRTLEENGPPPYRIDEPGKYFYLFKRISRYSPVGKENMGSFDFLSCFTPKEYTVRDGMNLIRSLSEGLDRIQPQLAGLDFEREVPRLALPVFFISGRWDFISVQDIAYRYFQGLDAPAKRFIRFERSDHNPCYQEPDRFIAFMRQEVLPLSNRPERSEPAAVDRTGPPGP